MNPFPVVLSLLRRNRLTLVLFVGLVAFAVALGIAVTMQERALRQGSARAADKFDLVIGAPGSPFDLVLASVYARPAAMGLIRPEDLALLLAEPDAELVAPIAFGDSASGFPILGTTEAFVTHLAGPVAEGRMFATVHEAVAGSGVPIAVGTRIHAAHDALDGDEHLHENTIALVGRLAPTNTAWDFAVIVPVEQVWEAHGLPNGHAAAEEEHEDGHDADASGHDADHDAAIGPPFDPRHLPGVPAVVVKPATVAAAYGLRNAWRTERTQALFPAEVLVQLYALLGDARAILGYIAVATQVLVVAAILAAVGIILQLHRGRFAVLRALGATRGYVMAVAWIYVTGLIAAGCVVGIALGAGASFALSAYLGAETGVVMPVALTLQELQLAGALLAAGAVLAVLPALMVFRQPVAEGLRQA